MTINNADVANQVTGSSLVQNGFYDGTGKTVNPEMKINGGTYTGGKYVIKNDDRGIMEINGGTFTGLDNSEGGSVLLNWNQAVINGGTFDGSAAIPGLLTVLRLFQAMSTMPSLRGLGLLLRRAIR